MLDGCMACSGPSQTLAPTSAPPSASTQPALSQPSPNPVSVPAIPPVQPYQSLRTAPSSLPVQLPPLPQLSSSSSASLTSVVNQARLNHAASSLPRQPALPRRRLRGNATAPPSLPRVPDIGTCIINSGNSESSTIRTNVSILVHVETIKVRTAFRSFGFNAETTVFSVEFNLDDFQGFRAAFYKTEFQINDDFTDFSETFKGKKPIIGQTLIPCTLGFRRRIPHCVGEPVGLGSLPPFIRGNPSAEPPTEGNTIVPDTIRCLFFRQRTLRGPLPNEATAEVGNRSSTSAQFSQQVPATVASIQKVSRFFQGNNPRRYRDRAKKWQRNEPSVTVTVAPIQGRTVYLFYVQVTTW
ncbi:hypothetical protein R3P38DRAFT_3600680 [Favolaschia claudopus]|uniref:Uncharacterized protein n=1 Tax=Favolaschia claudopus TaxID=2862362 RepID=A0AAW0AD19_9AGAR